MADTSVSFWDKTLSDDKAYQFTPTQDWFSFNVDAWRGLFPRVRSTEPRVLEIGSWEGRSAVFLLTELCAQGGEAVCIDHFDLMKSAAGQERYSKITHNLSLTGKPFRVLDEFSFPALMTLLGEEMDNPNPGYDWIYVDGSHEADDTFLDGELVWRLAKKGAVVIFDDYHWDKEPSDSIHHPKRGIDAFMTLHRGEFDVLSRPEQYQVVLQKTSEMRIGFLLKEKVGHGLDRALGYGMHVALTVDSTYAMAAAVAIRSCVSMTKDRITFYIIDLGLSPTDRQKLEQCTESANDATIVFLTLPSGGLTAKGGKTWAKIDMIPVLPIERVLYLDADVLVRADLRSLWDIDLAGKPLGAARDVGYPMGHGGPQRGPYFNAGVLLMDLAQVRGRMGALSATAESSLSDKYADQDALNTHFRDAWLPLPMKWNAQGLGTYAELPSADRALIESGLLEMKDAAIVHFTGPVNPALEHILNPYLQPYIAKSWGYAGAPGHPYTSEWWTVLDETPWSDWRHSDEYKAYCASERDKVIESARHRFLEKVNGAVDMA
ncbi:nucleotide-diphospho-sugar transferase [Fomitopsis serialis]|uniref:nucleotide-diphospho-sugar transferase n=1 Tax=Fomitopsis serialis TaxID=139415 RepID=UPI002007E3F9|nr:nucleotide-diphospho-sugar transferase [Neoantrodia serialis]KAH9938677.1 nucleotide-diphospho-sugar transferase [Neoantrodia serialis]